MKIRYFFMSMAVVAAAMTGFTSCSDDDDVVVVPEEGTELQLPEETIRVRIGDEYRVPVATIPLAGGGEYSAYSLAPEICGIETDEDGIMYVAGYKNGTGSIVLTDAAGNYKRIAVAVYTTDQMQLNYSTLRLTTQLGKLNRVNAVAVAEGNGGYEAESGDERIEVSVDAESGALSIVAAAEAQPYSGVVTVTDQTGLTAQLNVEVIESTDRVKIGADTRAELDIDPSFGEYTVECLSPQYAEIVEANGKVYLEGKANGVAYVNIGQGDLLRQLTYSVYTTDVMKLSHTTYGMVTPLGLSAISRECSVLEGNGDYSITSDNQQVRASINSAGEITLTATSKKDPFTANVTVTDVSGLQATIAVTVTPTFDAFVQSDYDELLAKTAHAIDYNGSYPWYFRYLSYGSYGSMSKTTSDGKTLVGYEYASTWWGVNYYTIQIEYPADLAVGQEGNGTLYYGDGDSTKSVYEGTVKLVADNDTKTVVCWWKVDLDNEKIDRGYVVYIK